MREILDRLEVAELFTRLARALDEGTPDDIRQIYTKDVVVHSPRGGEIRGIDNAVAYLSKPADEKAQHMHSDVLVDVDGDRAEASAYQLVSFYRDGEPPHQRNGVRLTYSAVRTPAGWRFDQATITSVWQETRY